MTTALIPVITAQGLSAVFNENNDGVAAKITHIALGDNGRTPSKNELSLVSEKFRTPIAEGDRIDDYQIQVTALADGDSEFWIREIGFFLEDGTMLAVWSSSQPLAYKSAAVPLLLAFDLKLESLPAQSVTISTTGTELSLAAYTSSFISSVTADVLMQESIIKNAHNNMSLSERIRLLEQ